MGSSYSALTPADRESYGIDDQPSSSDLAAQKMGPPQNPYGEQSPDQNDPRPMKDGADNSPKKDGSANPPKKTYQPTSIGQGLTMNQGSTMGQSTYGDR